MEWFKARDVKVVIPNHREHVYVILDCLKLIRGCRSDYDPREMEQFWGCPPS